MKLHVLQHAACEGPGEIALWAEKRGHSVTIHHLYAGDALPAPGEIDGLIVLGGEMNIYQYRDWPWLKPESAFIRATLEAGKRVAGICLGAQFIADALGARVVQNAEIELGWMPVTWTAGARALLPGLPAQSTVLHWHGDTFSLPAGATRLAASEACPEQGYFIEGKCLGLQFHLEVDAGLAREYVEGQVAWPQGRYVHAPETIAREAPAHCEANRQVLYALLDRLFA
ncbi:MAG: type 1 glutamine amidotransferase [Verrucomicrobiota bacterium]